MAVHTRAPLKPLRSPCVRVQVGELTLALQEAEKKRPSAQAVAADADAAAQAALLKTASARLKAAVEARRRWGARRSWNWNERGAGARAREGVLDTVDEVYEVVSSGRVFTQGPDLKVGVKRKRLCLSCPTSRSRRARRAAQGGAQVRAR